MTLWTSTSLLTVLLAAFARAAAPTDVSQGNVPDVILLEDDFGSGSLDPGKWQCMDRNWPVGQTWFKGCPSVADGFVTLAHHTYNPHNPGGSCLSQEIVSLDLFERLNGVELVARVRVRTPIISGLVTSFFTYTDRWVVDHLEADEFDFEFLTNQINNPPEPTGHRVVVTAFNDFSGQWNLPPYHWTSNPSVSGLDLSQFNTFKMHWWPDRIEWYWDPTPEDPADADVLIGNTDQVLPDEPTPVRFNFWAATCSWPAACDPSLQPVFDPAQDTVCYYDIDYVKVRREPYIVQQEPLGSGVQYKCYRNGYHFLTVIDDGGVFAIRPHPGVDENGWGSTLYLQPFLPGAVLKHSAVDAVLATVDGISVQVTGHVSRGESETFGDWQADLGFQYLSDTKTVAGSGTYQIQLPESLSLATGDLNLSKIASNYLDDVPTLRGVTGDTGDTESVLVEGQNISLVWIPPDQPDFYPQDQTDWLSMTAVGRLNDVDTAAQGYQPIAPAYKPSVQLILASQQSGIPMIFGGQYDPDLSQLFWEDNVGITPLILWSSPALQYGFSLSFNSQALPGDGNDADFDGVLDSTDDCPNTIFRVPVDEQGCPPLVPADFDRDGDVDTNDHDAFEACASGPGIPQSDPHCAGARLDGDNDVDQADFSVFQGCYGGENVPADSNCAG